MGSNFKPTQILEIDTSKLKMLATSLEHFPELGELSLDAALQDTQRYVTKYLPKLLPNEFGLSLTKDDKRFASKRSKGPGGIYLGIEVRGPRNNLARFTHSPSAPNKGRYTPRALIYRSRGIKEIKNRMGPDGEQKPVFLGRTGAKSAEKIQVIFFRRTGEFGKAEPSKRDSEKKLKPREIIASVTSMAVPNMVLTEDIAGPLLAGVTAEIDRHLELNMKKSLAEINNKLNR